ncbi:MAG: rhodanese-like domain-containing protein [Myxococcota bacterium]
MITRRKFLEFCAKAPAGAALASPLAGCFQYIDAPEAASEGGRVGAPLPWVLPAAQAVRILGEGAVVLDARDNATWSADRVDVFTHVTWQMFSQQEEPSRGLLLADDAVLGERVSMAGVAPDRDVLVVGDPVGGWGEDGRIVWMLRTMGHDRVAMVDGGIDSFRAAGAMDVAGRAITWPGTFALTRDETWGASFAEVEALVRQPGVTLIDTREAREYAGETPYGEVRGGHVPGAVHLYFKDFLDASGSLLPVAELEAALSARAIKREDTIVSYCTGGVRSAWFLVVLVHLGFEDVRNYAGSMWEWSAMGGDLELP